MSHPRNRRNVRDFLKVLPEKRRNSQSIRRHLFDVVKYEFDGNCALAADRLSALLRECHQQPGMRTAFSAETLYKATRDISLITYNQLDSVALQQDVPVSLILAFTRVRAEIEASGEQGVGRAKSLIRAFQEALNCLYLSLQDLDTKERSDALSYKDFLDARAAYAEIINDPQESLF